MTNRDREESDTERVRESDTKIGRERDTEVEVERDKSFEKKMKTGGDIKRGRERARIRR